MLFLRATKAIKTTRNRRAIPAMRKRAGIPETFKLVRFGIPFTVTVTVSCPEENPGFEA